MMKTIGDVYQPALGNRVLAYNALMVTGAVLFIALAAQIRIPLPFTPIPLTGQTFAVLLAGAILGSGRGVAATAVYAGAGLAGLPLFTGAGSGLAHLAGPTGGYLAGFVAAAAVTGWLAEKGWGRTFGKTAAAMAIGNGVIYILALPWFALFVGADRAIELGLIPFLLGDVLKIAAAALLLPAGWKWLCKRELPTNS